MGQVTIQIGQTSRSRTIDDAKLQAIVTLLYTYGVVPSWPPDTPLPQTPAAQLAATVDWICVELRRLARSYKSREVDAAYSAALAAAVEAIDI